MQNKNLSGKKGLIIGIANNSSIAWGCANAFRDAGAELAITYLNDKAKPYVQPLAEQVDAPILMPLNVVDDVQLQALFDEITQKWGKLDFLLHAIAFAPLEDLHGRVIDSSREGFLSAIDISCHSFARIAKLAEPLMTDGGCMLTTSYYGGEKVVENYNIMGAIKASLEGLSKYMAAELGEKNIRVNTLSPGPIPTRAAGGIKGFEELHKQSYQKAPLQSAVSIHDVGAYAKFLVSDEARFITGNTVYIDSGYNIMAP
ncbi:MAG: enoyl-[acyl-carrier-protein] reductase FabI [Alphaproteobacteria bacterium]|nr:MAG: enoyl-[acyl-carrier-protein] reductase FabI [Alphaproteobacteria bacterium]